MKYHLSSIMRAAWRFFRKGAASFSMALRMAWANEKAHRAAQEAAGIAEETHTWAGWKQLGYEVRHESKAMFQTTITDPATKSGTRRASYFGRSQVQQITV
ncbi:MAG: hypothetical protein ACI3W5_15600 [Faecousia sp.]